MTSATGNPFNVLRVSSVRGSGPQRGRGSRGTLAVAGSTGRGRASGSTLTHDNTPLTAENRGSSRARGRGIPQRGRGRTIGSTETEESERDDRGFTNPSPYISSSDSSDGETQPRWGWTVPEFTLDSGQEIPDSPTSDVAGSSASPTQGPKQTDVTEASDVLPSIPSSELRVLSSSPNDPRRPGYGTCGRPISLRANRLPIQITHKTLYLYHVDITPAHGFMRSVIRRIYQLAEQTISWQRAGMVGTVAHDSAARLVSSHILPQPLEINILYPAEGLPVHQGNGTVYTLSIRFVRQLETGGLIRYLQGQSEYRGDDVSDVISALNLAHATARGQTGVVRRGNRTFFHALGAPISVGVAIEAWRGCSMVLQPAPAQLMVKIDVSTAVFWSPGNLVPFVGALQNRVTRLRNFLNRLPIETTHTASRRIIRGVSAENANTLTLVTPQFGQVTIREYFLLRYHIQLQYPQLPLVEVAGATNILLPPEVCVVPPGEPYRRKLSDEQDAGMVRIARRPPHLNGHAIHQLSQQPTGPILQRFGLDIIPGLVSLTGHVLPKPTVVYSTNTATVEDYARWNTTRAKFISGVRLDRWAVLVIKDGTSRYNPNDSALRDAVKNFRDICNKSGMYISTDPTYTSVQLPQALTHNSKIEVMRETLLRIRPKPNLVMAVLPGYRRGIYEGLKYVCDVILDVASVCVLSTKFCGSSRAGPSGYSQYLSSITLKLNVKLGGINHRLTPTEGSGWLYAAPTMVIGMYVKHPTLGAARSTPSVAAVVASVDDFFVHYPASLSIQSLGCEMITDLKNMTVERLSLFKSRNNGTLPERILVYRSGLSESHFRHMRETEVPSMLAAFQRLSTPEKPYRPKLTIVASRKKHHTWFWADESGDGNPPAGTVVDRGVTSVYDFDFYLQAHGGVGGTARPILYTVIYDENGVTADGIQETTHTLSYMYAPATQAVSVAAPIRYAELSAKRGCCYLYEAYYGDMNSGEESVMEAVTSVWKGGVGVPGWGLSDTMFYI